jgi:hypothetical protein
VRHYKTYLLRYCCQAQADQNNQNASHENSTASPSISQASDSGSSDFWSALSQEISGLRDTLDGPIDEGDAQELELELEPVNEGLATDFGALLFSHSPNDFREPPYHLNAENRAKLLDLYVERVDCMYKVLHWPSILARIQGAEEPEASPGTLSRQALEYAIYFVTLCTISDDEAEKMSLDSKADLVQQYKDATEHALSKADVMRHPDMTSLQAFVIYLVS